MNHIYLVLKEGIEIHGIVVCDTPAEAIMIADEKAKDDYDSYHTYKVYEAYKNKYYDVNSEEYGKPIYSTRKKDHI